MVIGLAVLIKLAQPVRGWKLALILSCEAVFIGCVLWRPLAAMFSFEFSWGSLPLIAVTIAMAIVAAIVLQRLTRPDRLADYQSAPYSFRARCRAAHMMAWRGALSMMI